MIDVPEIVNAVASVLPHRRPIAHHEASINGAEIAAAAACLRNGLTGTECIRQFEERIAAVCGTRYAVALSSGTAALHLALVAAGVRPGDEVLVPALTFVATANAVVHAGAVPNFVDGAPNVNAYKLRCYLDRTTKPGENGRRENSKTGRPITALIVVHLLGIPADMANLAQVARDFNLILIEDAAQALGSRCGNRACGTHGVAGALSFNNNKICTTNGGGAVITDDEWIVARAAQLSTQSRIPHPYKVEHDAVAYNARMGNVNAAIGCAQIDRLDEFIARKSRLAEAYRRVLSRCGAVEPVAAWAREGDRGNHWMAAVRLDPRCPDGTRDKLLDALHADGIQARALFTPLHMLPMYEGNPRDRNLLYAEDMWKRTICLPSGPDLCA